MNHFLEKLAAKKRKLAIGLMSGTSLDGMDAVLIEIEGYGSSTKIKFLDFLTLPYNDELRSLLIKVVMGEEGGSRLVCGLNFLLGDFAAEAALSLCRKAGIEADKIDFAASHGQTIYHLIEPLLLDNKEIMGTLQIGEAALIAEKLRCPVVSDFRVRDMAAGGQGAPLVPYTEYLLYRQDNKTIALQNIGGIGNVTLLPAACKAEEVLAFDTGPGNMIIDAVALSLLGLVRDDDGKNAAQGKVHPALMEWLFAFDSDYLELKPPKTTGRERYNEVFVNKLLACAKDHNLSSNDILATVTRYTAETILLGIKKFCSPMPQELYVSGGGAQNKTLMAAICELFPGCKVQKGDALGVPADAKEAVAFAILGNEALHGICNNVPSATGATHPVVMGKISF